MQDDFNKIGFQIKFYTLRQKEYPSYDIVYDENFTRYLVSFEAEDFKTTTKKKRNINVKIIQIVLLIVTCITVYFSAIFYISYIEPYYGDYGQLTFKTVFSIISFCMGMFLIVVIHEFGHILFSRHHKLKTSLPYLIPGPPPLGMFGAFVSVKDDPQTRNQKFDVAIGGIVLGIIISIILIIAGFFFSTRMDTNTYIQSMAIYSGNSLTEVAQHLHRNINLFNFLFLGLRYLFYDAPVFINLYEYNLPQEILILHPLAYSGWIGLLLSGLNLIPLSFYDGGHLFKAIFPNRYTKLIGFVIGLIIWLILSPRYFMLAFFGLFGAIKDLSPDERPETVPNPTIPLTKSRKIVAVCLLGLFIILWPLSFNSLIIGISF